MAAFALVTPPPSWGAGAAALHVAEAERFLSDGRPDEAIGRLWQATECAPRDHTIRVALATALRQAGRPMEALGCLRCAVLFAPSAGRPRAMLGDLLRLLGELGEARSAFEAAVELQPSDAEAWLGLAECLLDTGEPERALASCEAAAEGPLSESARARLRKSLAKARALVEQRLVAQAEAVHATRDWPASVAAWEAVLAHNPAHSLATLRLIPALRHVRRIDDAEALSLSALPLASERPAILTEHALNAAERRDWAEALVRWQAAAPTNSERPSTHLGMARALIQLGRLAEADAVYRQALVRFPGDLGILRGLAICAVRRKDWPAAAESWGAVLKQNPKDANVFAEYAAALAEAGDIAGTEETSRLGLERNPEHGGLLRSYAQCASLRRAWDEASERWSDVLKRFPNDRRAAEMVEVARRARDGQRAE